MSACGALSGFAEGAVGRELPFDVRFTPESGRVRRKPSCLLWANSGHFLILREVYLHWRKAGKA
jgi:hypothetical protein